jgi:hypothetical protein
MCEVLTDDFIRAVINSFVVFMISCNIDNMFPAFRDFSKETPIGLRLFLKLRTVWEAGVIEWIEPNALGYHNVACQNQNLRVVFVVQLYGLVF